MKAKSLFTIALIFSVNMTEAIAAIREVPVRSSRTLRQEVDSYAELLQKDAAVSRNNRQRFQVLNQTLNKMKALRDNSEVQGISDEAHMDLMVSVLESLPRQNEFKKKDCARYENDLLNQFEPTAEEAPIEPAVRPAWDFLQAICR